MILCLFLCFDYLIMFIVCSKRVQEFHYLCRDKYNIANRALQPTHRFCHLKKCLGGIVNFLTGVKRLAFLFRLRRVSIYTDHCCLVLQTEYFLLIYRLYISRQYPILLFDLL